MNIECLIYISETQVYRKTGTLRLSFVVLTLSELVLFSVGISLCRKKGQNKIRPCGGGIAHRRANLVFAFSESGRN